MKIGIKLLLASVFVLFTALSFAHGTHGGDDEIKVNFDRAGFRTIQPAGNITSKSEQMKKAPIRVVPRKTICPIKPVTK
ncbi:MAG: hypothetical protein V4638_08895 [Bacteroidota bacterium]